MQRTMHDLTVEILVLLDIADLYDVATHNLTHHQHDR